MKLTGPDSGLCIVRGYSASTGAMPQGSVTTYFDFNAWLDVISGLNRVDAPAQMQFEVHDGALAADAYTIEHVLTWLRAHAIGAVHHLLPEFPAMEPHVLEFDDILDAAAFGDRWSGVID